MWMVANMKTRNYGIDLLRLVLMFMVCVLHALGQGGVLVNCEIGGIQSKVYWFMEIFSLCAVNGFAMISGYTASDTMPKYFKIIQMWFQVFFYSFVLNVIFYFSGILSFNLQWVKLGVFPVLNGTYWYFTSYVALFFAMPILNKFLFSISTEQAKRLLVFVVFLYSVYGFISDPFITNGGYSPIWLMVIYVIGVTVKRTDFLTKTKTITLLFYLLISLFITWVSKIYFNTEVFVSYISPTILFDAIVLVVLFSRLKLSGKLISKLSPLAFGVYLLQINRVVWNDVIKDALVKVSYINVLEGIIYVLMLTVILFVAGLLIEFFRIKIYKLIRIDALSKKIAKLLENTVKKLAMLIG